MCKAYIYNSLNVAYFFSLKTKVYLSIYLSIIYMQYEQMTWKLLGQVKVLLKYLTGWEWECLQFTSQSWGKPSWSMPSRHVIFDRFKAACWWNINLRFIKTMRHTSCLNTRILRGYWRSCNALKRDGRKSWVDGQSGKELIS